MHEASIALSIINAVEQQLAEGKIAGRVETVSIRVGRLTAVVPDNLKFLFGVLSEDTPLAGSSLDITMVPVRGRCRTCGISAELEKLCFLCSGCGSPDLELTSGRELELTAVEVR
jgi:hydrogenase nickel incorporation protein HypA/HybF